MSELISETVEAGKSGFVHRAHQLAGEHRAIREGRRAGSMITANAWLGGWGEVFALPRWRGDSRYPYGKEGFNFWAYASGYMHANEGLLSYFQRSAEGREPAIAFFAGLPEKEGDYTPFPLLQVPKMAGNPKAERCTVFTPAAVYYLCEVMDLRFTVRVFAGKNRSLFFSLLAENTGDNPRRLFFSHFMNPFLRHQLHESDEDRWFKEIRVVPEEECSGALPGFTIRVNEDKDRYSSITRAAYIRQRVELGGRLEAVEATASRYQFVGGSLSSLHTPESLFRGTFGSPQHVCTFTESAIAGGIYHLALESRGTCRLDMEFGEATSEEEAGKLCRASLNTGELDDAIEASSREDRRLHSALRATISAPEEGFFPSASFNSFFEFLKRQVEFCSLIKGYIQLAPNSLIGIRDVFQALEALAFWQPKATRGKMLEAMEYMTPDGRFFRQYSLPEKGGSIGKMDLREFIDQGTWVISAVSTYIRLTGDFDFLREETAYHEIVDEDAGAVRRSRETGTVLAHLDRAMDYLLRNRDSGTGCVRALYGDWNDALDGLGLTQEPGKKFGSGVSVMATLQTLQNAREMAGLLAAIDRSKYRQRIESLERASVEIEDALNHWALVRSEERDELRVLHGWGDGRRYLVGGFCDSDGAERDSLTATAYWVNSGVYDKNASLRPHILKAFDRLDSKYGLRTFAPAFPQHASGVGRIGKLPPGTAENGAVYIHATAFALIALFRMGEPRRAWDQLFKILPFTSLHKTLSHSPFVMPNSYGYNPELCIDGENMNDWQTGSSNVVLKCLIRYVFGFEPGMDSLRIQPASWAPFEHFVFQAGYRSTDVHISYQNKKRGMRAYIVSGKERPAERDDVMRMDVLSLPREELDGLGRIDIEVID